MKKQGRKAFILLSDDVDFRGKTSLSTAMEYAQRGYYHPLHSFCQALVPYRPLRSADLAVNRDRGRKVMRRLAAADNIARSS